MADFSEFPDPLRALLQSFSEDIAELMADLKAGRISLETWRQRFGLLLASHISGSYFASGSFDLQGDDAVWIRDWLANQLDYLDGFEKTIRTNYEAGGQYSETYTTRAQMYVTSIVAPYWYGAAEGLPIPAYPGDGTSQCMQGCNCALDIRWIDHQKGDADIFWLLNQKRVSERNCQTCIERARQWNPIRVRDWALIIPPSAS